MDSEKASPKQRVPFNINCSSGFFGKHLKANLEKFYILAIANQNKLLNSQATWDIPIHEYPCNLK